MAYRNEKEKYYVNLWDKQSFVKRKEQRIVYITLVFTYPLLCECSHNNGAAMRVSPVAHWYDTLDEVLDAAAGTALPSHNHDEGIKGAQTVAMAIFKALQFGQDAPEHIDEMLADCVEFSEYDIDIRKEDVINCFDETCQGTVPVALWIISESTSFEDAVRKAVSLGADADTLGAIVGSIAEAIWGIPEELKRGVMPYLTDEMKEVVEDFYERIS